MGLPVWSLKNLPCPLFLKEGKMLLLGKGGTGGV
jgi:hypothetical protein